ncbi:MAG: glycosyltransferase family 2 protein [Leptolyngbyaceae bacterium]|nr:glycosyltransferase family 2 protein [Leptolyngbyaceae bacterium]
MKKVSVIISVYGVEAYIAAAVRSVLAQTYINFELLIIDDGSPDRSVAICEEFTDPRITIIRQANRGLAGARNTGIRHAQGEYLAFLDGDDLWLPEKLERHVQHLEASPTVGVSFSRSAFIDQAGNPLGTYLMSPLTDIDLPCLLRGSPIGNGSAPVIRREVFAAIKFQDPQFQDPRTGDFEDFYFDEQFRRSEDIECWLRIVLQTAWKIEGIPEPLTLYRVNTGGLSANFLRQLESWQQVLRKIRTYAPEQIIPLEPMAMAYEFRYLARSAIRMQSGDVAMPLIHRALCTYPAILCEEPRRTLSIWTAACLLWLMPLSLYRRVESLGAKLIGNRQKQRIFQDRSQQATL